MMAMCSSIPVYMLEPLPLLANTETKFIQNNNVIYTVLQKCTDKTKPYRDFHPDPTIDGDQ